MHPDHSGRNDWVHFPVSGIPEPSRSAARVTSQLQDSLLNIAITTPRQFSQEVVDLVCQHLPVSAATLFTKSRGLQSFKLEAASGFPYADYESFLLHDPSYPSIACSQPTESILVALAPLDPSIYRNHHLLGKKDIGAIVVVPFHPPLDPDAFYPDPMGALCLYPTKQAALDEVVAVAKSLQRLIGTLYMATLERRCMDLRARAVQVAAFEGSPKRVCDALLRLFCGELGFDAGSAWLLNPRRQQLLLRSAWPAAREKTDVLTHHAVRLDSLQNPLAKSFNSLVRVHHPRPDYADGGSRTYADFDTSKIMEDFGLAYSNTLVVPLRTNHAVMLGHVARNAVGVIELTNKYVELGGRRDYIPTTWEDLMLVEYLAEISSVLVFQGLQASDHEADYERRIHGLKINLIGARDSLQQLEDRGELKNRVDPRFRYHVPNALEWIREMEQQVGRRDNISRLEVKNEAVNLQSGVLAKSIKAARDSARARKIPGFFIDADEILGTSRSLIALIDDRAFLTVLRNLFENSMKYRNQNESECRIEVWCDQDEHRDRLYLHLQDNGIGISRTDRVHVFEDGYRGHAARAVHVLGEGIGLHECAVLMEAMKGSITCEDPVGTRGAHFILTLPTARAR